VLLTPSGVLKDEYFYKDKTHHIHSSEILRLALTQITNRAPSSERAPHHPDAGARRTPERLLGRGPRRANAAAPRRARRRRSARGARRRVDLCADLCACDGVPLRGDRAHHGPRHQVGGGLERVGAIATGARVGAPANADALIIALPRALAPACATSCRSCEQRWSGSACRRGLSTCSAGARVEGGRSRVGLRARCRTAPPPPPLPCRKPVFLRLGLRLGWAGLADLTHAPDCAPVGRNPPLYLFRHTTTAVCINEYEARLLDDIRQARGPRPPPPRRRVVAGVGAGAAPPTPSPARRAASRGQTARARNLEPRPAPRPRAPARPRASAPSPRAPRLGCRRARAVPAAAGAPRRALPAQRPAPEGGARREKAEGRGGGRPHRGAGGAGDARRSLACAVRLGPLAGALRNLDAAEARRGSARRVRARCDLERTRPYAPGRAPHHRGTQGWPGGWEAWAKQARRASERAAAAAGAHAAARLPCLRLPLHAAFCPRHCATRTPSPAGARERPQPPAEPHARQL
jgi:hypothetical protein